MFGCTESNGRDMHVYIGRKTRKGAWKSWTESRIKEAQSRYEGFRRFFMVGLLGLFFFFFLLSFTTLCFFVSARGAFFYVVQPARRFHG